VLLPAPKRRGRSLLHRRRTDTLRFVAENLHGGRLVGREGLAVDAS
jgi:hypothetical protein